MLPKKQKMQSGYPLALLTTILQREFTVFNLLKINQAANERLELLMQPMRKAAGITEQLKAPTNCCVWVDIMDTVKAQAIIFAEVIYVYH